MQQQPQQLQPPLCFAIEDAGAIDIAIASTIATYIATLLPE